MKGCFGCVALIVVLLVIAVVGLFVLCALPVVGGALFLSTNIFSPPEVRSVPFTKNDGHAAQQKLFEVALRQSGRSSRRDPLIITEPEANAFLSRHLEQSGLPLSPIVVRFANGEVVAQGQTAFRNLLKGVPFRQIAPYLSTKRLDEPVWVTVGGRIKVEGTGKSRTGSLEITQFAGAPTMIAGSAQPPEDEDAKAQEGDGTGDGDNTPETTGTTAAASAGGGG